MTLEDLAKALEEKFSIGHGGLRAWGTCLRFKVTDNRLSCVVQFPQVPHRNTGKSGGLEDHNEIDGNFLRCLPEDQQLEYCVRLVRDGLRHFMLHELDESLLWEGKRRWDPHAMHITEGVVP